MIKRAFTLIELLVVIAIVGVLAALLLPTLHRAKSQAQALQCLGNLRQVTLAWAMYTSEHDDDLPWASGTDPASLNWSWMNGCLDYDPFNSSNWDVERDIKTSLLWPYFETPSILKCPSDKSTIRPGYGKLRNCTLLRVRSISMNRWFGNAFAPAAAGRNPDGTGSMWRKYFRLHDLVAPGPSMTFLFLDQREDSINAGNFDPVMAGFPDQPQLAAFASDYPSSYHGGSGNLSFADGHVERHHWTDRRTNPPLKPQTTVLWGVESSPNNADILWLQEHATRRLE
jgi:prepilin-type N-terminal cleavage/methylation domain-containing protein/prepilin-type processing-associated H-X9-DG protein